MLSARRGSMEFRAGLAWGCGARWARMRQDGKENDDDDTQGVCEEDGSIDGGLFARGGWARNIDRAGANERDGGGRWGVRVV